MRRGRRLVVRERSWAAWGWIKIVIGGNWRVVLGTVLAIIAVVSIGVDWLGATGVVVVIALIGLVPVILDWRSVRAALNDLQPVRSPVPDVHLKGDWELDTYLQGRVATSRAVDESLEQQGPVSYDPRHYALPAELKAVQPAVIAHRRRHRGRIFDGPNVRLASGLKPEAGPVVLQALGYYDVVCSDYMAEWQWRGKGQSRTVADVTPHIIDRGGYLIPIEECDLACQIGISTVAVTSDGWMILVIQGDGAYSSAELVAPTGSGSLEPIDLRDQNTGVDRDRLVDVIAAGMERELREECGLYGEEMEGIDIETQVIGFGRWLEKGAKPEFFGFSRIKAPISSLKLRIDVSEQQFVGDHLAVRPSDVRRLLMGDQFEQLGRGLASVPLDACLTQLRKRYADGRPLGL